MIKEYLNLVDIYRNTSNGVFLVSASGRLIKYNDHLIQLLGYDSEEEIDNAIESLFTEVKLGQDEAEKIINEIIEKKRICVYELKLRKKDRTFIDTKISVKICEECQEELMFVGLVEDISEQKNKEKEGLLTELKYKDIFENSNDAIYIVRGDIMIEFNKKTREIFDLDRTIDSLNIYAVFPEKQPDGKLSKVKADNYIKKVLSGKPQKFDWVFKTLKNRIIFCEVSLTKIELLGDDCYHVVIHDLTKRVEAEQKVKRSEERYKLLVDTAPVGILRTNVKGEILFLNKKVYEIVGFDSETKFLEHYQTMNDIYENKSDRKDIIERLSKGEIVNTKLDIVGANKNKIKVNIISSPVFNKVGKPEYFNTVVEDITEKIKLEKKVRERDEMLISISDSFPFEIYVTDSSDIIIMQNELSKEMFGNYLGKRIVDLPISKEVKKRWAREVKKIKNNETLDYEISVEREGKIFHFRRILTPLIGEGIVVGVIVMSIDISERKLLQKEIELHRDNLEYIVKKRTKEVRDLNDKLRVANDEMSAANEFLVLQKKELEQLINELKQTQQQLIQSEKMASVGVLTAGIAHEINNPVNFISSGLTGLELLVNDILEALDEYADSHCSMQENCKWKQEYNRIDKAHRVEDSKKNLPKLIKTIRNGVQRTTEIVKGLRTFSRLDVENMLPSNINDLIDSSLIILRTKYKNRIEIIKNYGTFEPVFCFPGKLSQVFLNLLINAIQAIEGEGKIEITTRKLDDSNLIEISIKDNGQGIPEKVRDKIFDPFFTTKVVGEGTGLGLSIVHSIIAEHNGEISVVSEENKGTEFKINLPISAN